VKRAAVLMVIALVVAAWAPCRAADDELALAQQRASALNFFNSLGVTGSQLMRMVPVLQRIQKALADRDAKREGVVGEPDAADALDKAHELLMADQEVPQETLDKLAEIRVALQQADQEMYLRVDGEMQGLSKVFSPAQNALLDFTPPASVRSGPTPRQLVALQREIDARVNDAVAMLDRVKFLNDLHFRTGRIGIIQTYLANNQEPGRPLPDNAVDICIAFTSQARVVPPDQWQQQAPIIAAQMVTQLGLMPTLYPQPSPNAIGWSALYQLFTAPETLKVAQEAQQYRQG